MIMKDIVKYKFLIVKISGHVYVWKVSMEGMYTLIYLLQVLKSQDRVPDLPIYLDSPMSIRATRIYRAHCEDHDLSESQLDDCHGLLDGDRIRAQRTHSNHQSQRHRVDSI